VGQINSTLASTMVVTSSAHVERLCLPMMAETPKAPMVVTSSAHVERLCRPWMAAVTVPKGAAPMAMTSSTHVERLCRPFMEGPKSVDFQPTTAYEFEDFHVATPDFALKKQVSKAYSSISTDAGSSGTPLTTPSASPFHEGAAPEMQPWPIDI